MRKRHLLLTALIISLLVATGFAWPTFFEQEDLLVHREGDYLPLILSEGDELSEQIHPARDGLKQITLSFDLPDDQTLPASTEIQLELRESGLSEPEEVILLSQANLKVFARTEIALDLPYRTAGKTYRLILHVNKLEASSRLAIHTVLHPKTALTLNHHSLGLATAMSMQFIKFNWISFLIAIVLIGLILLIILYPLPFLSHILNTVEIIPLILAPFMTLATVELLNTLNTDFWLSASVYWISLLVVLSFELLLISLFGHFRLGIYFNHLIFVALGFAHHMKLFFRGDPFVAGDLHSITEAAHTINQLTYRVNNRFFLALLLTILYVLLFFKSKRKIQARRWRIAVLAAVLAGQVILIDGVILDARLIQKTFGVSRYPWNQMVNYNQNGVVVPFLQSTRNLNADLPKTPAPADAAFYQAPLFSRRTQATVAQPNIIAIMSESFCDFDNISTFETSEPVTPFFDQLKNSPNARYGNLLVSIFGGGTCNTEFEFLTGSSMLFMADGSLPYNSYFMQKTHGLPDLLNQQGYRSVAIHPYLASFWDRNLVYPALGFDDFISLEDFPSGGLVRDFVSDRSDFKQIIQTMETKKPDERLFVFSVTMQNHFPYHSSEEILQGLDYNIKIPGMTDVESVELYLSLLRQSDDALRDLIYYLAQSKEPTLVVIFGDHLPGNNNSFRNFYEILFHKDLADLTLDETEKMYETPWMIWANYQLPQLENQVLSPNFLATTVLDLTRNAKSPYFELVDTVHESVQAMSNKMIITREGQAFDRERIPASLSDLLDRYWAAEYDNVIAGKSQ